MDIQEIKTSFYHKDGEIYLLDSLDIPTVYDLQIDGFRILAATKKLQRLVSNGEIAENLPLLIASRVIYNIGKVYETEIEGQLHYISVQGGMINPLTINK